MAVELCTNHEEHAKKRNSAWLVRAQVKARRPQLSKRPAVTRAYLARRAKEILRADSPVIGDPGRRRPAGGHRRHRF